MLLIDPRGHVVDAKIKSSISTNVERGPMPVVTGIIVHQTDGSTAKSALDSYRNAGAAGAHFLIEKDGTIYQTASLFQRTWHVGRLKARCLVEQRCTPAEIKTYQHFNPTLMNRLESAKRTPARYPSNEDSIGIELVGLALAPRPGATQADKIYETVTAAQNVALKWLIGELNLTLRIPMTEVFRHPEVSWKNPTEASTAKW